MTSMASTRPSRGSLAALGLSFCQNTGKVFPEKMSFIFWPNFIPMSGPDRDEPYKRLQNRSASPWRPRRLSIREEARPPDFWGQKREEVRRRKGKILSQPSGRRDTSSGQLQTAWSVLACGPISGPQRGIVLAWMPRARPSSLGSCERHGAVEWREHFWEWRILQSWPPCNGKKEKVSLSNWILESVDVGSMTSFTIGFDRWRGKVLALKKIIFVWL